MLYLIGGASRSGKTMLAERILEQDNIAYLSLDWIMMGFTRGLPKYGIHDKLMPDEIARKLWPFLRPMLESMVWSGVDYVIEGEAILPDLLFEFIQENKFKCTACFLGYSDIDYEQKLSQIRKYSLSDKDWLTKESDNYICDHIQTMAGFSVRIKESCETFGFRYFDTSKEFLSTVKDAKTYLLKDQETQPPAGGEAAR